MKQHAHKQDRKKGYSRKARVKEEDEKERWRAYISFRQRMDEGSSTFL
jgi:hypothetical protein